MARTDERLVFACRAFWPTGSHCNISASSRARNSRSTKTAPSEWWHLEILGIVEKQRETPLYHLRGNVNRVNRTFPTREYSSSVHGIVTHHGRAVYSVAQVPFRQIAQLCLLERRPDPFGGVAVAVPRVFSPRVQPRLLPRLRPW